MKVKKKKSKQNDEQLKQIEEVAESLGIKVRYEKIQKESVFFPGGYCKVKGQDMIIINSKATLDDKVEIIARALNLFDLSQIYVLPAVRELIDKYAESTADAESDPDSEPGPNVESAQDDELSHDAESAPDTEQNPDVEKGADTETSPDIK